MASGLGLVEIGLMASNMTLINIYNLVIDVHFCCVLLVAYLKLFLWPRPHSLWPWPRAKLASLTSLSASRGVLNHRGDNSAWEDALDLQSPSRVNSGIGPFILGIRTAAML